jgi:nucleoside-diphosphate-sugar epimerase
MNVENIAISGATGWLGVELISKLSNDSSFLNSNIFPTASKNGSLEINGNKFAVKKLENLKNLISFDYFFDFAFVTREKLKILSHKEYSEINKYIMNQSVDFIKTNKPRLVVLASSGAVYKSNYYQRNRENYLYGELKQQQESEISKACKLAGSKLIIVRIFNLSGSGIKKLNTFAIAEFIYKSVKNQDIIIKSNYNVVRQYCDIGQLLDLVTKLALENKDYTFDSGGVKIEIRELAREIVGQLSSKSKISALEIDSSLPQDVYLSNSNDYEKLLSKYLKQEPVSIKEQIVLTKKGLIKQKLI